MKMTLPALACLLLAAPAFAVPPAPVLDVGQFCGEQAGQMREALLKGDVPDAIRRLTELFTDVTVCSCARSKLSASPYPVRADDEGMRRYMRANAECLSAHVAARFPAICPAIYADLVPRMGYRGASPAQVSGMCRCAASSLAKQLTSEEINASLVEAYEDANERRAAGSNPVFDAQKSPRPQPMEIAFQELQSCGARILGPAR